MLSTLNLLRIHIRANTKSTFTRKLYQISTNSTKCVKDIARALLIAISTCVFNPASDMFRHGLWSNRIPWFVINLDASVKFAEKVISFIPESFYLRICRNRSLIIYQIVSFWAFITVEIFFMRLKYGLSVLNNHNYIMTFMLANRDTDFTNGILADWQFLILTFPLLLISILHAITFGVILIILILLLILIFVRALRLLPILLRVYLLILSFLILPLCFYTLLH